MEMKRVLSVASECVPLIKTGGLADVVGALPAALRPLGWDMRVLMPAYRSLRDGISDWPEVFVEEDLFGGRGVVRAGVLEGMGLLLLDAPHLYDREGGPYNTSGADWPDNPQRFAALSWVAAKIARHGLGDGWRPQILHAHDWQAGFAPAYLAFGGPRDVGSVITIHNIAFQGWADASMVDVLRLPRHEFHPGSLEYFRGAVQPESRDGDGRPDHDRIADLCGRVDAARVRDGTAGVGRGAGCGCRGYPEWR